MDWPGPSLRRSEIGRAGAYLGGEKNLTIEALLFVFEIDLLSETIFLQERVRWMLKLRNIDGCRSVEIMGVRMATVPMLPVVIRRNILIVGLLLPTPTIATDM